MVPVSGLLYGNAFCADTMVTLNVPGLDWDWKCSACLIGQPDGERPQRKEEVIRLLKERYQELTETCTKILKRNGNRPESLIRGGFRLLEKSGGTIRVRHPIQAGPDLTGVVALRCSGGRAALLDTLGQQLRQLRHNTGVLAANIV